MVESLEIKKYAMHAAVFILSSLTESELAHVRQVILFGSVAGSTATSESDVDIFVDSGSSKHSQAKLKRKINGICEKFYLSNTALEFKMNKTENEINIIVGNLKEWSELARSISANGIILYGKYSSAPPKTKPYTIFAWKNLGKSKGAFLNKIYGYRVGNKRYPGILKRMHGIKLGKATVMIPAEERDFFTKILDKYRIDYSRYDVWV